MKKIIIVALAALSLAACCKTQSFKNDPLGTQIYTLDNGLKVYMSVNKDEPRIQTYIAVRTGGKTDPADNTGLAHYLEHIMFKGTEVLGTSDYAAEKPILDQIEALYDVYRTKTDEAERRAIYHVIDSLSYEASKISIPNEYDKAMSLIGSRGSNAYTSNDVTCYQEDIPSNQIENWAKVQSDRFMNMVIRGFHTELEAVYEEFNMHLNEDQENVMNAIDTALFKKHPYGKQTVIGTQAHLKNPSISAIKKQKATYYVPDNTAICLSGDFDPKEMIKIIEKYFGGWERSGKVPEFKFEAEDPITEPVEMTVYGTEAEFVMLGWSYPGAKSVDSEVAQIAGSILSNGMAGLFDLDINQQQKTLGVGMFNYGRSDYGETLCYGYPKDGQSLEEVKGYILEEIAKLRNGEFDPELVQAAVANYKLRQTRMLEQNRNRASAYVSSFTDGTDWKFVLGRTARLEKLTAADIQAWAQKYLRDDNYAICYKKIGENPMANKIVAPAITPIATNRDMQSAFLKEIQDSQVDEIEPVWVDFEKDMSVFTSNEGLEVIYKKNESNDIANVAFSWDCGTLNDPSLAFAADYVSYLGTPTRSAEEIALEMYKLACNFYISVSQNQLSVSVSGLSENIAKAIEIVEDVVNNAVADEDILDEQKMDALKGRYDAMFSQSACSQALANYAQNGPEFIKKTTLTNAQLVSLKAEDLLASLSDLKNKQHKVLYYGTASEDEVKAMLSEHHKVAAELEPVEKVRIAKTVTSKPQVIVAPYDARQFTYTQFSVKGEKYDPAVAPMVRLFNEYFGSGMNSIVFQEMREARALAYSAGAVLSSPSWCDDTYMFFARIGSQNDKLKKAVDAFDLIINDMPQSEAAFNIAKAAIIGNLRTSRTKGVAVLNSYLRCRELGLSEPSDKLVYETLPNLTLEDLTAFQQEWIKGRTYQYSILGDWSDLDTKFLRTLGPVKKVSLEEIFGY